VRHGKRKVQDEAEFCSRGVASYLTVQLYYLTECVNRGCTQFMLRAFTVVATCYSKANKQQKYDCTQAVAQLIEALRYKPEGRGFDSRRCHSNFSLT
jgi:hypothetical protein